MLGAKKRYRMWRMWYYYQGKIDRKDKIHETIMYRVRKRTTL